MKGVLHHSRMDLIATPPVLYLWAKSCMIGMGSSVLVRYGLVEMEWQKSCQMSHMVSPDLCCFVLIPQVVAC